MMIGRNIGSARPITIAEVEALLQEQKDRRELSFEQQTTLDYSKKVAMTSGKAAHTLVKELTKLEKLTPEVACKLVDLLPVNKEQLMAIVSKERYTLSEKEIGQILAVLAKAAAEKPKRRAAASAEAAEAAKATGSVEESPVAGGESGKEAEAGGKKDEKGEKAG